MRALFSLLVITLALVVSGCPLAPPRTSGESAGAACGSDLECSSGLACECGVCAEPSGEPPRCVDLDDACEDVPSECFQACGDPTVVGSAECVAGRETCSGVDGVLRSQCAEDTCWGVASPGEICLNGELQCQFPPRSPSGDCYTFECIGDPGQCVPACGDGSAPAPETCLADEWKCESGVPVEDCGECVGPLPSCVISCEDLTSVGSASCDASLEWSCAHIILNGVPASVDRECGVDAGPDDGGSTGDGGQSEGGPSTDAGLPDAGGDDHDAGSLSDGGTEDASVGDAG